MRRTAALLPFLVVASPLSAQTPPDLSPLDSVVRSELRETGVPGAAVAVVSGDRVVAVRGYGLADVETGAAVSPDMLFHIGSVTKLLTATAAATLARQGKLRLDAPIGGWVPGLDPRIGRLTLHQLLSQTAGLRDMPGDYGLHEETALGDFARSLKADDLLLPAGTAFSYSNPGLALAGYALEKAAGKPYADAMDEILFQPLGMRRTTLRPTTAMTFPLAQGHAAKKGEPPAVVRPLADDTRLWPAGYAFTTAGDLARFAIALLNDGRVDGKQALPPGVAARLMQQNVAIPTNVFVDGGYGYGLFVHDFHGLRMVEHGGELPGYSAQILLLPERRAAVVTLLNGEGVQLRKTFAKAFDLLAALPAERAAARKQAQPITAGEMARWAGTYANRWSMDLFVRDGALFLRRFGDELPVTKVGENRLSVQPEGLPEPQEFVIIPGTDGKPEAVLMFLWAFKRMG